MYNIDHLDRIVRILRKAVYRPGGNNGQSLILPSLQFFSVYKLLSVTIAGWQVRTIQLYNLSLYC